MTDSKMFSFRHHEDSKAQFWLPRLGSNLHLSAEERLIVDCVRTWTAPGKIRETLDSKLDWGYIMEIAVQHRIEPLLYYKIEEAGYDLVPLEIMESLQTKYFATLRHNALVLHELSGILKFLSDMQTKVIVLKGAALAETVYRDTAPRPFGDIDLLIYEEDKCRIEAKLFQLGYEIMWECNPWGDQQFQTALHYASEGKPLVDLHWQIFGLPYSRYIDIDSFWESAVPVNIEGVDALALSAENLLIHLCLHASKHLNLNFRLLFLVDISEVINHYADELDWGLFLEKVEQYRIHSSMRYVLHLAKALFEPPMPASVLDHLSCYKPSSFEARVYDALADPNVPYVKWAIASFLTLDGIMPRIRYLFGKFYPGRHFVIRDVPDRSKHSLYFSRLSHVLQEGMKTLPRLFMRVW